jgi:hypothetical protein
VNRFFDAVGLGIAGISQAQKFLDPERRERIAK